MHFLVQHHIFDLCYIIGVVYLKLEFSLFLKMLRLVELRVCSGSSF